MCNILLLIFVIADTSFLLKILFVELSGRLSNPPATEYQRQKVRHLNATLRHSFLSKKGLKVELITYFRGSISLK